MFNGIIEDKITPELQDQSADMSKFLVPQDRTIQETPSNEPITATPNTGGLMNLVSGEPSWEAKNQETPFNWDKSNIDRYKDSSKFNQVGFELDAGTKTENGKPYDANELRYGQLQTWGDIAKNAFGGAFHLAVGSFEQSVESWGHTANALFTWGTGGGWKAGKEALLGTPEELKRNNDEQNAIMNKYAIYHTPYGDSHLFSREFIGDIGQQMGFGIGMGAEILAETFLTGGIADGFKAFSVAAKVAEGAEALEKTAQAITEADRIRNMANTAGEITNDLRKVNDISTNRTLMTAIRDGAKNLIPGIGLYDAAQDVNKARAAGAVGWNMYKQGVPGVIKTFSMANAAKAESMMEASNTYGQLYGDLLSDYQSKHDGQIPMGDELERIKRMSYGAATDNFIVNTGLLMTMNQLEFGSMFSKFGSAKRLMTEAIESGEKGIFSVSGTAVKDIAESEIKAGEKAILSYKEATGLLSGFRNVNAIRKDFGLGTALWTGGKRFLGSQAAKFEISEGIQELLQNSSDQTFRDYYKDMYDGGKDINGTSFFEGLGRFNKGVASQNIAPTTEESWRQRWESNSGWKTFLMGAATGLFMNPLSNMGMYASRKGYSMVNKEYKSKLEENKALIEDNNTIMNSYYKNPAKMLSEHIANIKSQGASTDAMSTAAKVGDKYTFVNGKQDGFAKAVATAIKTDNYESFIGHLESFTTKFKDNKEFEQAFPNLKSTDMTPTDMRNYIGEMSKDITEYYNNWYALKDKYADKVMPELRQPGTKEHQMALIQKKALDDSLEILASTSYHAKEAIKRITAIKQDTMNIPTVGLSAAISFEHLLDEKATQDKINALQQTMSTYKALGKDETLADNREHTKEQLMHLTNWQKHLEELKSFDTNEPDPTEDRARSYNNRLNKLRQDHKGYVKSLNEEETGKRQTIANTDIEKAFGNLWDTKALTIDHSQYVRALDVLSTIDNFKKLHERHTQGIIDAYHYYIARHMEEVAQRTATQTNTDIKDVPEPTNDEQEEETPEENTPSTTPPTPGEPVTTEPPVTPTPPPTPTKTQDEINDSIAEYYTREGKATLNNVSRAFLNQHSKLKKRLDSDRKSFKDSLPKLKGFFKQTIEEYIANLGKPEAATPEQISAFVDRVVKGEPMTATEDIQFHSINKDAIEAELQRRKDETGKDNNLGENNLPKLKILNSQVTIGPHKIDNNESRESAMARLTDTLSKIPSMGELWDGLSIVATPIKEEELKGDRDVLGNPNIIFKAAKFSIGLQYRGQPLGYLTNAGRYSFLDKNGKPVEITPTNITHYIDTGILGAQAAFDLWENDKKIADTVMVAVQNAIARGTNIQEVELFNLIAIIPHVQMDNLSTEDRKKSDYVPTTLAELGAEHYELPVSQSNHRMLVVDNKPNENGVENVLLGTDEYRGENDDRLVGPTKEGFPIPEKPILKNSAGTYSVTVHVGLGQYRWIQVTPTEYSEQDINNILDTISSIFDPAHQIEQERKKKQRLLTEGNPNVSEKQLEIAKRGIDREHDALVKEARDKSTDITPQQETDIRNLLDSIFISLPVYKEDRTNGKGVTEGLKRSVQLRYVPAYDKTAAHISIAISAKRDEDIKIPLLSMNTGRFLNAQDFANSINQALQGNKIAKALLVDDKGNPVTITPANFKHQIPLNASVDEIKQAILGMTVSVKPNIVKSISLTYAPPGLNTAIPLETLENKQSNVPIGNLPTEEQMNTHREEEAKRNPIDISNEDFFNSIPDEVEDIEVPFKVVKGDKAFDEHSIENIDRFKDWVNKNLPGFISVAELDNLVNNLNDNNITVGQFLTTLSSLGKVVDGTIQTNPDSAFKYHEAFHAIFRLLLPQAKIDQLLDIAKRENLATEKKLNALKELHPSYRAMSKEQLTQRFYEEHLADRFDAWKMDRKIDTSHVIKSFFARVMDWIREVFAKLTGSQIEGLFYEIDRGKYKKAQLQQNQFTNEHSIAISEPAMKVIKIGTKEITNRDGKVITVDKFYPQAKADQLSSNISALFHQRVGQVTAGENKQFNKKEILKGIIETYKNTYNARLPFYLENANAQPDIQRAIEYRENIKELHMLFRNKAAITSLIEATDFHLQLMGYKQELDEEELATIEEEVGSRNTDNVHKKVAPLSDYGSLSKFLRGYIGSTTYSIAQDEFGNKYFLNADGTPKTDDDGEPIPFVQTVNATKVYNGLLKVLSNNSSDDMLLDRLIAYKNEGFNPETTYFIQRLFNETNFQEDTKTALKNAIILQQVLKGFNQFSPKYLFTQIDTSTGQYRTSYANSKDSDTYQFNEWYDKYQNIPVKSTKALQNILDKISGEGATKKMIDESKTGATTLTSFCKSASNQLWKELGISLHPTYIKFSIIHGKDATARTEAQQTFIDSFPELSETVFTHDLLKSSIYAPIVAKQDIFSKDSQGNDNGSATYLKTMAAGNAFWDENVNTMSFTNANNEVVFSHQFGNYDFSRIIELNDEDIMNELQKNPDYQTERMGDPAFQLLLKNKNLRIELMDGLRAVQSKTAKDGTSYNEGEDEPGATYADFNRREYLASILGLWDIRKQKGARQEADIEGKLDKKNKKNKQDYIFNVRVPINTIEAKSSIHLVSMPVVKAATGGHINTAAQDIMFQWVQQEFERIQRVQKEIDNGEGTLRGYHTESDKGAPARGLHLFITKLMVGNLTTEIEELATKEKDKEGNYTNTIPDALKEKIKDTIKEYWKEEVQQLANMMVEEGLIKKNLKGEYENVLAPQFLFHGYGDPEMDVRTNMSKGNFMNNLTQVAISNLINTTAINRLLYGEMSKSFADSIDIVKRMAGANAAGPSMSTAFSAQELGIYHSLQNIDHVTYENTVVESSISGKDIDSDDGQMYMTEKGYRYALFGFGKLNKVQADILTRLRYGYSVSSNEFYNAGGLKDNGPCNSLKLVYFDGQTYLKCSSITLFKEYTSVLVGNEWQPMPGRENLHTLRMKLEQFEDGYDDKGNLRNTVAFAHPVSVSKGMKNNVAGSINEINDSHYNPLPAKYMRQQLEVPSNKVVITDPSQIAQQIMAEQDDKAPVMFFGVKSTVGAIKAAYMNDMSQRKSNNYNRAANSIFTLNDAMIELGKSLHGQKITPRLAKFLDMMKETLQASGSDQQTLAFLETRDNEAVYNLNFPSTLEKYTQSFLSYFSKGVLQEKVPGLSVALVSGANGMGSRVKEVHTIWQKGDKGWTQQKDGQPKTWTVITDKQYKANPERYSGAKRWATGMEKSRLFTNLKEGDYIIDDLRHNYEKFDKDGNSLGYYSEYIRPGHNKEEADSVQEASKHALGIRIPSDDKHSYITLEQVDVMPVQYGSIGVFPHEMMEISGADFDIDKMYIMIPDTYVQGKNRVAYGTATTDIGRFNEYLTYQFENNKELRNLDEETETVPGTKESERIEGILKTLGLPSTIEEYMDKVKKGKEPNNGVLNNRILAQRIAMQNNEHVSGGENAISNEPTSTKPLANLAKEIASDLQAIMDNPDIKDEDKIGIAGTLGILNEKQSDPFFVTGQTKSYGNNMEGARNIGAAANAVQAYSLCNQFRVGVDPLYGIRLNHHTFRSFGESRALNAIEAIPILDEHGATKGYNVGGVEIGLNDIEEDQEHRGTRIFANLGTLLNAMTDNAKERLAARLGLNITALGYVSNMVSLGIPMKTAILMMLQPWVRTYFKAIQSVTGKLRTEAEVNSNKGIILAGMTMGLVDERGNLTDKELLSAIANGGQNGGIQSTAMLYIKKIDAIGTSLMSMAKVQKLSQGLPTNWEDIAKITKALSDLNIEYKNGEYSSRQPTIGEERNPEWVESPIDVRDILLHKQEVIATNIQALANLQNLARPIFMEKTPLHQRVTDIAIDNFKRMKGMDGEKWQKTLKHDIISFMTIKAYRHWLLGDKDREAQLGTLKSLNTAMVYPEIKAAIPEYEDVVDIMNRLKSTLTGKNKNYLVSNFLSVLGADSKNNKDGINKVEANTFAKLSEYQQDKLISSYVQLYSNNYEQRDENDNPVFDEEGNKQYIQTHDDAVALFNYLLVKDGGQFKSGTFIRYIPVYMFKDIMDRTTEVNALLGNPHWDEQEAQRLWGSSSTEMFNQFIQSYSTHIGNKNAIQYIRTPVGKNNLLDGFNAPSTKGWDAKDIAILNQHAVAVNRPVIVTPDKIMINLYQGTSFADREKPLNQAKVSKNKAFIRNSGFRVEEKGNKVGFPYAITINNTLYTLKGVGLEEAKGQLSQLIGKDDTLAQGTHALYEKAQWVGSKVTFKAQGVFGALPIIQRKEVAGKEQKVDDSALSDDKIQAQQYQEQPNPDEQQQEQQEQEPQPQVTIKGIEDIYNNKKDISSIGSLQQYNDYIKSIFPNTTLKEVVYHYTDAKEFDTFRKKGDSDYKNRKELYGWGTTDNGIFFTKKSIASNYGNREVPAILNTTKTVSNDFHKKEIGTITDSEKEQYIKEGVDGIIQEDIPGKTGREIVVFEPSQVHILGNANDVKRFKEWIQSTIKAPEERLAEKGITLMNRGNQRIAIVNDKEIPLAPNENTINSIIARVAKESQASNVSSQELIGGMFTKEELNGLYKRRVNKEVTAERFKKIAEDYLSVPWKVDRKEIEDKLLNCA